MFRMLAMELHTIMTATISQSLQECSRAPADHISEKLLCGLVPHCGILISHQGPPCKRSYRNEVDFTALSKYPESTPASYTPNIKHHDFGISRLAFFSLRLRIKQDTVD